MMLVFERASAELRALARELGVTPHLSRARSVLSRLVGERDYERRFSHALLRQVSPGDVVWDIGANVGFYTLPLRAAVGENGKVVAIEPTPTCFAELRKRTEHAANVTCIQAALGDRTGSAPLAVDEHALSTTNSLFVASQIAKTLDVRLTTGDDLVSTGEAASPNVLKIDVEGFEEEVLRGLDQQLARPSCRAVFCEVHFGILDARGERHAPARIVELLRAHGFGTRWIDASHLCAVRRTAHSNHGGR